MSPVNVLPMSPVAQRGRGRVAGINVTEYQAQARVRALLLDRGAGEGDNEVGPEEVGTGVAGRLAA